MFSCLPKFDQKWSFMGNFNQIKNKISSVFLKRVSLWLNNWHYNYIPTYLPMFQYLLGLPILASMFSADEGLCSSLLASICIARFCHSSMIFWISSRCDTAFLTHGILEDVRAQLIGRSNCLMWGQFSGRGYTLSVEINKNDWSALQ